MANLNRIDRKKGHCKAVNVRSVFVYDNHYYIGCVIALCSIKQY